MSYINQKRRLLAGMLALLLLGIVVFMSFIGYSAIEIREQIEMSREFKNKSIEDYLELNLSIQSNFITAIESDWRGYEDKEDIEGFVEYSLMSMPILAIDSIIVAYYRGDTLFKGYYYDEYSEVIEKEALDLSEHNTVRVINGNHQSSFGQDSRFYYDSTQLDDDFIVVVGFLEEVMYSQFISSLNVNIVETINEIAESVTFYTSIFMLFVLLFGLFLLYQIRKLGQEFTLSEICVNCKEGGKPNDE